MEESKKNKTNRRKVGAYYEQMACDYLDSSGYEIIERNFRCRMGEIDIIAGKEGVLVFAEVKFRRSGKSGMAEDAVTFEKQRIICKVAVYYLLRKHNSVDIPIRFDVIAINTRKELHHIENAFDFRY